MQKKDGLSKMSRLGLNKRQRNFIRQSMGQNLILGLIYQGSQHNFSARKFRECWSNSQRRHSLTLVKTEFGRVFGLFTTKDWRVIDILQKKETAGKKKNDAVILSDTRAFVIQANDLKVYKAKQETYQILNKKDSFPGCSYSKEDISADLCFVD